MIQISSIAPQYHYKWILNQDSRILSIAYHMESENGLSGSIPLLRKNQIKWSYLLIFLTCSYRTFSDFDIQHRPRTAIKGPSYG